MQTVCQEAKSNMQQAVEALKRNLASVRTGRPNPSLLSRVKAPYYGTPTALNEMAAITIGDGNVLVIKPWEKNVLGDIEKAILEANLNLTAVNDGEVVRVPVPVPTTQRRQELVKQAKQRCEEAKVAIRTIRRDTNELLRSATKQGDLSQDEEKRALKQAQDLTDTYVNEVDALFSHKEKEILSI
ncbi:MAG: ribosome recycling factor [Myxococcota bacterium]